MVMVLAEDMKNVSQYVSYAILLMLELPIAEKRRFFGYSASLSKHLFQEILQYLFSLDVQLSRLQNQSEIMMVLSF